jgi:hypothetical protein
LIELLTWHSLPSRSSRKPSSSLLSPLTHTDRQADIYNKRKLDSSDGTESYAPKRVRIDVVDEAESPPAIYHAPPPHVMERSAAPVASQPSPPAPPVASEPSQEQFVDNIPPRLRRATRLLLEANMITKTLQRSLPEPTEKSTRSTAATIKGPLLEEVNSSRRQPPTHESPAKETVGQAVVLSRPTVPRAVLSARQIVFHERHRAARGNILSRFPFYYVYLYVLHAL